MPEIKKEMNKKLAKLIMEGEWAGPPSDFIIAQTYYHAIIKGEKIANALEAAISWMDTLIKTNYLGSMMDETNEYILKPMKRALEKWNEEK